MVIMLLSPKQIEAHLRATKIRNLRGFYGQARYALTEHRAKQVMALIDEELVLLEAQPQSQREREDYEVRHRGYYKGYGKRRKFVPY